MALTRRQKQVLDFLVSFLNSKGYSPSFEEIAENLGLSSLATVHKHLHNLETKGYIKRKHNHSRALEMTLRRKRTARLSTACRPSGESGRSRSPPSPGGAPAAPWRTSSSRRSPLSSKPAITSS